MASTTPHRLQLAVAVDSTIPNRRELPRREPRKVDAAPRSSTLPEEQSS